jgi:hypothetical protein
MPADRGGPADGAGVRDRSVPVRNFALAVLAPAYLAWVLASMGWQRLRWWLWWRKL